MSCVGPAPEFALSLFRIVDHQRRYLVTWMPWVTEVQDLMGVRKKLWEWQMYTEGGQQLITFIFYDNLLVGSIGFIKLDKVNHKAELGYWVREEMQGKGLITRSCSKLLDYGFQHLGLNRIFIRVPANNEKSMAIPERLKFRREGLLREDMKVSGRFHDVELYGILKKDWK